MKLFSTAADQSCVERTNLLSVNRLQRANTNAPLGLAQQSPNRAIKSVKTEKSRQPQLIQVSGPTVPTVNSETPENQTICVVGFKSASHKAILDGDRIRIYVLKVIDQ